MNQQEIAKVLRGLGLREGDMVLLHSSLASIGHVEGGAEAVRDAFLQVLGKDGTLAAPTFEPGLGLIAEAIARHPTAVHSVHPLASVAAIGKDAEELCRDHWKAETAHVEGTPYMRIAEKGGYVCLLGVDQDRNTTLHTAEAILRLPYLSTETRTFQTPEGTVTKSWPYFPGPHRNFIGLDPLLRQSGRMKMAKMGNAAVRLIRSRDLIDLAMAAGRKDPGFVLCRNPECPDCRTQRASLVSAELGRESFRLVASASLAGEFVDDIVARCAETGITAIELDAIARRPLTMAKPVVISQTVQALRAKRLEVVAIRSYAVSKTTEQLVRAAAELGVPKVVLPLTHEAKDYAAQAFAQGLALSFFNTDLDSDKCSELLLQVRTAGFAAGFTFNGANFARGGELPFLVSYKKRLRRFVDQLDLVDGTYSGSPARLGCGNAEVKEMISILRCAGFAGHMTLAASNAQAGSLNDAVSDFLTLLREM